MMIRLILLISLTVSDDSQGAVENFISRTIEILGGYWSQLLQLIPTLADFNLDTYSDSSDAATVIQKLIEQLDEDPSAQAALPFGNYVLV